MIAVYALTIDAPTKCADECDAKIRSRVLTSARTATRNFDLQLAIATLRLPRPSFMSRLERIRTLPVVYGGNRAGLFVALGPGQVEGRSGAFRLYIIGPKTGAGRARGLTIDNSTVLQRRPFSKGPIVAIVDFSHCGT